MTTFVARALAKLFKAEEECRTVILGLDASGRTTALYQLVLGQVVTTIPTIGFNVETAQIGGVSITMWDVGGCDKIRPLWRHYFQNTQGLVFFVDSRDKERIGEARDELHRLAREDELRDAAILVIANKQDLPNVMSLTEVEEQMGLDTLRSTRGAPVKCLPASVRSPQLFKDALIWFTGVMREIKARSTSSAASSKREDEADDILSRWLKVEDEADEVFLASLEDFSLQSWDHRTHLRVAWLMLSKYGRKEGMQRTFSAIRAFIENSPRTKRGSGRGTTFHETLTFFWIHMVHYAMASTKNHAGDFKTFLLLNPQLTNGGLHLHYYTKRLIMDTPEARSSVVLPDKVPLPSLLPRQAQHHQADPQQARTLTADLKALEQSAGPKRPVSSLTDVEFVVLFERRGLPSWGHEHMLRLIYAYLGQLGHRRAVDKITQELRAFQGSGFSTTITHFWIQMMTAALTSDYAAVVLGEGMRPGSPPPAPVVGQHPPETRASHVAPKDVKKIVAMPALPQRDKEEWQLVPPVPQQHAANSRTGSSSEDGSSTSSSEDGSSDGSSSSSIQGKGSDREPSKAEGAGGGLISVMDSADSLPQVLAEQLHKAGAGAQQGGASWFKLPSLLLRSKTKPDGRAPSSAASAGPAMMATGAAGAAGAQRLPEFPELLSGRGYLPTRLRELVQDPRRCLKYYSKQRIYSEEAAQKLLPPDKKPLPSTL
mmetsp:Transcript_34383/g.76369  ORF Transcript_34383/g.76369 Transcript_34383/m.76369 type:complete len:712 (+) Transcript_34383:82-2217(+)